MPTKSSVFRVITVRSCRRAVAATSESPSLIFRKGSIAADATLPLGGVAEASGSPDGSELRQGRSHGGSACRACGRRFRGAQNGNGDLDFAVWLKLFWFLVTPLQVVAMEDGSVGRIHLVTLPGMVPQIHGGFLSLPALFAFLLIVGTG
jgi:hypothetical protein